MEAYFQAKRLLFASPLTRGADRQRRRRLRAPAGARSSPARSRSRSTPRPTTAPSTCGRASRARASPRVTPDGEFDVRVGLPGPLQRAQRARRVGRGAGARRAGGDDRGRARGAGRVPGRFEPVDEGQPYAVLVDYSHTPDSLENALRAARELAEHRVIAVFGAGGDRDRGKRPLMGAIAAREADVAIVTSDNPRSEDPDAIIAEILAGIDDRAGRRGRRRPPRRDPPRGRARRARRRARDRRQGPRAGPGVRGRAQGALRRRRGRPRGAARGQGAAREALERQPRRGGGRGPAAAPASRRPRGRRPVAGHDRLARGRPGRPVRRDPGRERRRRLVRRDGARGGRLGRAGDGGVGGRGGRGRARGGAAQPDADRGARARWRAPGGATWPRT